MRSRFSTLLNHELEQQLREALETADRHLLLLRTNATSARIAEFLATLRVHEDLVVDEIAGLGEELARRRGIRTYASGGPGRKEGGEDTSAYGSRPYDHTAVIRTYPHPRRDR